MQADWSRYAVAISPPKTNLDRSLPVISVFRQHDKLDQFMGVLRQHDNGQFRESAPMVDEMMTDDRTYGVVNTRIGAVLSSPLSFKPSGDTPLEQDIADEIGGTKERMGLWDEIFSTPTGHDIFKWGLLLGIGVGKIEWDRTPDRFVPRLVPYHPQHVRWDWTTRRFLLQLESSYVILPRPDQQPRGDGQWFVFCPFGVEYGWRSAIIRWLALKYMSRQWTERDWDRWCERAGQGILKATVPAGAQPAQREDFFTQVDNVGSEAAVMCPQDPATGKGYDISVVEFMARNYDGMKGRREALDTDIAIGILGQNLTTESTGGGLGDGGAKTQNLVRIDYALRDAKIALALRSQILTWYCEHNHGDPNLAPTPVYGVAPPDDDKGEAEALKLLGEAGQALKLANPRTDVEAIWEANSIPQISEEELAQQEEEKAAKAAEAAKNAPPTPPGFGGAGGAGPPQGGAPAGGFTPGQTPKKEPAALSAFDIKKRYTFAGLPIAVENTAGSIRLWTDADGKQTGSTKMLTDYGFIEGHLSGDGEELDAYVGGFEAASDVYVVHQLKAPDYRAHDEDKVMLGFASADDAKGCYLAHRDDPRAFGSMSVIPLDRFKAQLNRRGEGSTRKIRASADMGRAATASALVALAFRSNGGGKRTAAGNTRAAKYQDALTKRAIKASARALAPSLEHLFEHVNKAESLAAFRKKLPGLQHGMDLKGLAQVVFQTNVLSKLAGIEEAKKET